MKSSIFSYSYYMGLSYRTTERPQQIMQMLHRKDGKSQIQQQNQNDQQKVSAIHVQKNKKRVQQIMKYQIPFVKRKQQESAAKRYKVKQKDNAQVNENNTEYLKVTKIQTNYLKTQASQNTFPEHVQNLSVQIKTPIDHIKPTINNQPQKHSNKNNTTQSRNLIQKRKTQIILDDQKQSVFNHFPSQLFISPVTKTKLSPYKRTSNASRTSSNSFFPSNRSKIQIQKNHSLNKARNLIRPSSCKPAKKNSKQQRIFNFDGTLQNHKIIIPERPKTADLNRRQKARDKQMLRNVEYHNYEYIAKRCIKLKSKRGKERLLQSGMNILPWNSKQQKMSLDLFDVSCSTIRGQFLEQN